MEQASLPGPLLPHTLTPTVNLIGRNEMSFDSYEITELNHGEVDAVAGGPLPLLALAFAKGFIMGAGTVAAGGALLDAAGIIDLW